MEGAGDLAALAIPFAAGVAAGQLACQAAGSVPAWGWPPVSLAAVTLLLPLACSGRRSFPVLAALFFCLGAFCRFSQALLPPPGGPPAFASDACSALKERIASIPYPHPRSAGLVQALMTGDRGALSRETVAAFRDSGASHILALSGLHLGLIYLLIRRLLALAGNTPAARYLRCALTLTACGFYSLMTGAGPSVIRAFLYIGIREVSTLAPGRKSEPVRVLLAALTLQLAFRPQIIGSAGFQLSYLAMLGITVLFPRLKGWYPAPLTRLGRADPVRRTWNAAALTISCQLFTAPLAWIRFHSFPKYFLLTNLLALPLSSAVILVSAITVALSAAGACPTLLVRLDDSLIQLLLNILEIIRTM